MKGAAPRRAAATERAGENLGPFKLDLMSLYSRALRTEAALISFVLLPSSPLPSLFAFHSSRSFLRLFARYRSALFATFVAPD